MTRYSTSMLTALALVCLLQGPGICSRRGFYYSIKPGDTLWDISHKFNLDIQDLSTANALDAPSRIFPGQRIFIPGEGGLDRTLKSIFRASPEYYKMQRICVSTRKLRNWQYIIIHHSATDTGNAYLFHKYHKKRGMKNGLAYHFVIGNGSKSKDGAIEAGPRWHKQLAGGHVSEEWMNEVGIGICLVGNFQKKKPTEKQLASLISLIKYLQCECAISAKNVLGHKDVKKGHTLCPGRYFPMKRIKTMIFS